MIDFNNPDLKSYKRQLKKICQQLGQWRYLNKDEQLLFDLTQDRKLVDRLVTTCRKRMWDDEIRQTTITYNNSIKKEYILVL